MRTVLLLVFLATTLSTSAQYNSQNLNVRNDEVLKKELTFSKLRLYPVFAEQAFHDAFEGLGEYTVLEDAMKDGKVEISEVSNSGQVNQLIAENKGNDTLFVMAGEIVKGGKQDRVIAQGFVLAPGETKDIAAFCVEQGRWSPSGSGASGYQFTGTYKLASNKLRGTVAKEKNQQAVWREVADVTDAHGSRTSTGTYTALMNADSLQAEIAAYLAHYRKAFPAHSDVVGFVAVSGDKVLGCDLFATNDLFRKSFENLLYAYATEAITNGSKVTISDEAVARYMAALLDDEEKQADDLKDNGSVMEHRGKKLQVTKF